MNCEEFSDLLTAYVDRELSAAEETLVKKHLDECASCAQEVEEIREFAREMHNASVPFRQATSRIEQAVHNQILERPRPVLRMRWLLQPAWIGLVAICTLVIGYWFLRPSPPDEQRLVAWGLQHYSLVDQVHPVTGDAETVRSWFRDHHQISVAPPQRVDYSHLTGCKMTEYDSHPVPLLRFQGQETKAVFILPPGAIGDSQGKVISQNGFHIELWKEGSAAYMAMSR